MKLIIQIPCYNEEDALRTSLPELPRSVPGFDRVEWLIVDDGSSDRTIEVARSLGVDHIVCLPTHQGLARAFGAGLEACVRAGADVIVNTDADNQYRASCIDRLVEPILDGRAQIVIGVRAVNRIEHFSRTKKILQHVGSWVVARASSTRIPDSPSGFRAFSREAALRLNVFDEYTYTLETIIQAGQKNIGITWVPVETNPYLRSSRLVRSVGSYVRRSALTVLRVFMLYRPLRFFFWAGAVPALAGFLLGVRWLFLHYHGDPTRARTPSLILAAILTLVGFQLWMFGLVADLMAANRTLLEDVQLRLRRWEADREQEPVRR